MPKRQRPATIEAAVVELYEELEALRSELAEERARRKAIEDRLAAAGI